MDFLLFQQLYRCKKYSVQEYNNASERSCFFVCNLSVCAHMVSLEDDVNAHDIFSPHDVLCAHYVCAHYIVLLPVIFCKCP